MFQLDSVADRGNAGGLCVCGLFAAMHCFHASNFNQPQITVYCVIVALGQLVSVAEMPVFQSDASVAIHQCGSGASLTSWATSAPAPPSPAGLADNTLALLHSLSVLCFFSTEGFWIFAF